MRLPPYPKPRERRPRRLVFEWLEDRLCFALAPMLEVEQHLHELINWSRAHPSEAAARYGVGLNDGLTAGTITADAKSPLARNDLLRAAVTAHVQDMVKNSFFSHTGSDNSLPRDRIENAGYTPYRLVAENLVWWGVAGSSLPDHVQLIENLVQQWFESAGHRKALFNPEYREVGTVLIVGPFTQDGRTYDAGVSGQNFGKRDVDPFLTGVGCLSRRSNVSMCDVTKPIKGATIMATRTTDQLVRQTTTGLTGDYDLQLPDGIWDVRIQGGGLPEPIDIPAIVIAGQNVKQDFVPVISTRWRNSSNAFDVNSDRLVTPLDALVIVNALNSQGPRSLPAITAPPSFFLDTNGDNYLSPADVLFVVNHLNSAGAGEGERATAMLGDLEKRTFTSRDSDELPDVANEFSELLAVYAAALDAVFLQHAAALDACWILDDGPLRWSFDGIAVSHHQEPQEH